MNKSKLNKPFHNPVFIPVFIHPWVIIHLSADVFLNGCQNTCQQISSDFLVPFLDAIHWGLLYF